MATEMSALEKILMNDSTWIALANFSASPLAPTRSDCDDIQGESSRTRFLDS